MFAHLPSLDRGNQRFPARQILAPILYVDFCDLEAAHRLERRIAVVRVNLIGCIAPDKVQQREVATGMPGEPAVEAIDLPPLEDKDVAQADEMRYLIAPELLHGRSHGLIAREEKAKV